MKYVFCGFLSIFLIAASPGLADRLPAGEILVYELKWGILKAGEAILRVNEPAETAQGTAQHVSLEVRTTGLADKFYRVRTTVDSFLSYDLQRSLLYKKHQEEGDMGDDITVVFDWEQNHATYQRDGSPRPPVAIVPRTYDPLGVLYAFRMMTSAPGEQVALNVSDGKHTVLGTGTILQSERIKTDAGRFQTFLVEPDMKEAGGVFNKSRDAKLKIWFSDDARRLPVRVASKVAVGSFTAELTSYVSGKSPVAIR